MSNPLQKHRSLKEQKDTIQPWKRIDKRVGVNENFIKVYGADKHPDPEVKEYYKKKGY